MSDTSVLKEFLISLGFHVDPASEKKFATAVDVASKGALAIGAAIAAAAVALGASVQRMAVDFDKLYFQSSRIGTSGGNIRAFQYAVSQLGGTADGASGSLENLAKKIRDNPGTAQSINAITGSSIRGHKLTIDNLRSMAMYFQKMHAEGTGYIGTQMAASWGIDDITKRAMMSPEFLTRLKEYQDKINKSGIDYDALERRAHRFQQAWRSIWSSIGIITDAALAKILGVSGGGLEALDKWFTAHMPDIKRALNQMSDGFMSVAKSWGDSFGGKIDWKGVGKDVAGFGQDIAKLAVVIKHLVDDLRYLIGLAPAINRFFKPLSGFLNLAQEGFNIEGDLTRRGIDSEFSGNGPHLDGSAQSSGHDSSGGGWFHKAWHAAKSWLGFGGAPSGKHVKGVTAHGLLAHNQQIAYDELIKKGMSPSGAMAIVGSTSGESLRNPADTHSDGASGVAHGFNSLSTVRANKMRLEWKGSKGLMPNKMPLPQQVDGMLWEMKRDFPDIYKKLQDPKLTADQKQWLVTRFYENPADPSGQYAKREGLMHGFHPKGSIKPVVHSGAASFSALSQIPQNDFSGLAGKHLGSSVVHHHAAVSKTNHASQNVQIHVTGASAEHTGHIVKKHLDGEAFNLVRYMQGAAL